MEHYADIDLVKASKENQTKEYYTVLEQINWFPPEYLIIYTDGSMLEDRKVSAEPYANNDKHWEKHSCNLGKEIEVVYAELFVIEQALQLETK